MLLDELVELALRFVPSPQFGPQRVAQPMDRLLVLRRDSPSSLEASLYEPVLCLILQGRKQVSIGDQTLSFGPAECLLVSHDLPVCSRVTRTPYLALVFQVDIAA